VSWARSLCPHNRQNGLECSHVACQARSGLPVTGFC